MSLKRKNIEKFEPTKKLISDGDVFIKKLLDKQLLKQTHLHKELIRENRFEVLSEDIPVEKDLCGVKSTKEFEEITNVQLCNSLRLLSDYDKKFYEDSKKGIEYLRKIHQNLNEEQIKEKLANITLFINENNVVNCNEQSENKIGRLNTECMLSIKPNSLETKLLKFALENDQKLKETCQRNDLIKDIEADFRNSNEIKLNTSKIQKKARRIANRIDSLKLEQPDPKTGSSHGHYVQNSKWDVKEAPNETQPILKKSHKLYGCELKPKLYTIRNGEIIRINNEKLEQNYEKLSIDEIKKLPRFPSYDPGIPSNILYMKNCFTQLEKLEQLFKSYNLAFKSINCLKGRMKGQAFIEFETVEEARTALETLHGLLLKNNKPLIVEFGKSKKN